MASEAGKSVFAKRRKEHVLILASGNKVRHLTIKPWMTAAAISCVAAMTTGYFAATTYLVLRDDLLGASIARQARIQHDYEDRIAALRAQVDRVTSRQLLDQQVVEKKVEKLMERQTALTDLHGRLNDLVERAQDAGAIQPEIPVPAPKPSTDDKHADASGSPFDALLGTDQKVAAVDPMTTHSLGFLPTNESPANRADRIFTNVTRSLKSIEQDQIAKIENLRLGADKKADEISRILARTGIMPKDEAQENENMGGPYIPVNQPSNDKFDLTLNQLDLSIQRLEQIRSQAMQYPFGNPIPGAFETSGFGYRKDPFLGTLALHPGIDFQGHTGDPARSTGAGTVVSAGPSNGYGNMVEIDHGNGISTRYGHLSAILVHIGQKVETGEEIGKVGSTGRSTGPHLHYEVRRNGVAIDPSGFLNAGLKLNPLL